MEPFIQTHVLTLEQVFSGAYALSLPWFQRAYAWSEKHISRLHADLLGARRGPRGSYLLGHVFLAKPGPEPPASIIDGHQRSISLSLLFGLLRDLDPSGPMSARLHALIEDPSGAYRLTPQPSVTEFFAKYVQAKGGTLLAPTCELLELSGSERNILNNRDHLRGLLSEHVPAASDRAELARFVLENCFLIVETVEDEEEAWTLLSIEEETGLDFHSSERAKVSLITAMPRSEQEDAARLYESAQIMVGADGMWQLLAHIRMLKARRRTSKPVEKELLQRFKLNITGIEFLREELLPRAEALARIARRDIGSGQARETTASALVTLSWLDHQLWVPAALQWLKVMGPDHPETPLFFSRLDRLGYLLKIGGVDPTEQENRFIELINDIDSRNGVERMRRLDVSSKLLAAALENLRAKTFYNKRFHALVLRRISWNVDPSRDQGPVDGNKVTVEHVLPRKPAPGRQWWQDFPQASDVADHCNRLGNLTFLSHEENLVAANSDYVVKRIVLAGASARFVLAELAVREQVWTPRTIQRRTESLIDLLLRPWALKAPMGT